MMKLTLLKQLTRYFGSTQKALNGSHIKTHSTQEAGLSLSSQHGPTLVHIVPISIERVSTYSRLGRVALTTTPRDLKPLNIPN